MKQPSDIDRDYLRRCKTTSPEQRLDWLAAAVDFAAEVRRSSAKKSVKKQ